MFTKTTLEKSICLPCLVEMYGRKSVRNATSEGAKQERAFEAVKSHLERNFDDYAKTHLTCPALCDELEVIVKRETGVGDPYFALKEKSNSAAEEAAKAVHAETLEEALLVAAAGNALDFSHLGFAEALELLQKSLSGALDIDERKKAVRLIEEAEKIVYVTDNAGELFFDKPLLSLLKKAGKKVSLVVKSQPVLNDNMKADVHRAGVDALVSEVVEWPLLGYEKLVDSALVIAKGQAAFLTMQVKNSGVIHVLNCKCKPVCDALGVGKGANVVIIR